MPKECKCPICLSLLDKAGATIHLPACYHYFHTQCLATHIKFVEPEIEAERAEAERNMLKWKERQPVCPVCRVPMTSDILDELRSFKGPLGLSSDRISSSSEVNRSNDNNNSDLIFITEKMRSMQVKMRALYERQRLAGGIIENNEAEIIVLTVRD